MTIEKFVKTLLSLTNFCEYTTMGLHAPCSQKIALMHANELTAALRRLCRIVQIKACATALTGQTNRRIDT